ncbi:MarR family winged helix-turn-helix transcriptional regulator [Microbacterium sp. C7(2022)]|uniref:MarR family winged helix-turn-helix transcriptional regulator n=1 Tax=Microbacterium sp. C7(2022) TaxID=2992759 RepID=UPI00237BCF08|nr:MarR family transcriptional regulator [Microbacterium sp. C7(2022)]MDE0547404.1 MarR family transcriptional regulator [Microbacterium sp. C7(2022)]
MNERLTVTLHHLVSELDAYADDYLQRHHGVSFNTFQVLAVVADVEPVDITHLARCLGVTKAAVSKRVPALVEGGWLTTSADPTHKRRVMVSLTPRAADLVQVAGGELEAEFTALFTDSRLSATGIEATALNTHLHLLTTILLEKGSSS